MSNLVPRRVMARLSWLLTLAGVLLIGACRGASPIADLERARALAADLRLQFNKADKASGQAVMADTDEASVDFAKQAQQAAANVNRDAAALVPILQRLRYSQEADSLSTFQRHWSQYQKVEQDILALAVENTNLKAQRLSFNPAQEAADAFRDSVMKVSAGVTGRDHCAADELALKAVLTVRETQVLLAPHIAEADEAAMATLEQVMTRLEQDGRQTLRELSGLAGATGASGVASATAALDRFNEIRGQIVKLSRQNTNVRSLALSLRQQSTLAPALDDSLHNLQRALESEGSRATR